MNTNSNIQNIQNNQNNQNNHNQNNQNNQSSDKYSQYTKSTQDQYTINNQNWENIKGNDSFLLNRMKVSSELRNTPGAHNNLKDIIGYDTQGNSILNTGVNTELTYQPYDQHLTSHFSDNYMVFNEKNQEISINKMIEKQRNINDKPSQQNQISSSNPQYIQSPHNLMENNNIQQNQTNNLPHAPVYNQKSTNPYSTPSNREKSDNLSLSQQLSQRELLPQYHPQPYMVQQYPKLSSESQNQLPSLPSPERQDSPNKFTSPTFKPLPSSAGIYSNITNYPDESFNNHSHLAHPQDFHNPLMTHQNNQLDQMRYLQNYKRQEHEKKVEAAPKPINQ